MSEEKEKINKLDELLEILIAGAETMLQSRKEILSEEQYKELEKELEGLKEEHRQLKLKEIE